MPPPRPEAKVLSASPGGPSATLRPDPIDRPAPTAVAEADRAAAMAAEMAAGGHGMSHGTYQQVDAGREAASHAPAPLGGAHHPRPKASPQAHEHRH